MKGMTMNKQEHVDKIHSLAEEFNRAVEAARKAGLDVWFQATTRHFTSVREMLNATRTLEVSIKDVVPEPTHYQPSKKYQ